MSKIMKILSKIFAGIGVFVTIVYTLILLYEWLYKSDFKLTYEANVAPFPNVPNIATKMESQNSAYKILFNYLKVTGKCDILRNENPDSIVDKMFTMGSKAEYSFIRDTVSKIPYTFYFFQTFDIIILLSLKMKVKSKLKI